MRGRIGPGASKGAGGFVLIHAIFFVAIIGVTVAVASGLRVVRIQALQSRHLGTQALYLAESGIAAAASGLARGDTTMEIYEGGLGPGSYRAAIIRNSDGTVRIKSTGRVHDVRRSVTVSGDLRSGGFRSTRWDSR